MSKIALFTVFYPGAEIYVDEFIESLTFQTLKDFDLVIVNDNYRDKNLKNIYPWLSIVELQGCPSISGNRAIGINFAIDNKYDYLLLCDVDDCFKPNRVAKSINALKDCDIVVNDLDIVSANKRSICNGYFSKSIDETTILDRTFIEDKNIFGFSNTAIRVASLQKVEFPSELRIVDWYYFTLLLNNGLKAKFIAESLTEYRQHSDNMIGISSFTVEMFRNLLQFKMKHYLYLKDKLVGFEDYYEQMQRLNQKTDVEIEKLLAQNSKKNPYPLWWQNVKS